MCLYPTLIDNPKYKSNKKNGGVVPHCNDKELNLYLLDAENVKNVDAKKRRMANKT